MVNASLTEQLIQAQSVGQLLRQARINKGLQIADLSSALKVPQRKIELLEEDLWTQLPDMSFTRALAQSVCRMVQLDPVEVLSRLPDAFGHDRSQFKEGLNAPFSYEGQVFHAPVWVRLRNPTVWVSVGLLLSAAALLFAPERWFVWANWNPQAVLARAQSLGYSDPSLAEPKASNTDSQPILDLSPDPLLEAAPSPTQAVTALSEGMPPIEPLGAVSVDALVDGIAPPAMAGLQKELYFSDRPLELRVYEPTKIDVKDAKGTSLVGGLVKPERPVFLGGELPLKVSIDNPKVTEVRFRGEFIDLNPWIKGGVAQLELR